MERKEEVVQIVEAVNMSVPKVSTDMVKPFSGEGDVVAWVAKVELVASLAGVTKVEDFLPLFLEGSALSVYLEMSATDKKDKDRIIQRLKEVYADSPFVAYRKLMRMNWVGEPVDVFVTEIRRLAGLAGFVGTEVEKVVRLTFINSLPESVSVELQQLDGVATMSVSDLLKRARILTANVGSSQAGSSAVVVPQTRRDDTRGGRTGKRGGGEGSGFRGKCFTCGGPHMARFCQDKKVVQCFKCGKEGHLSYHCESAGNE